MSFAAKLSGFSKKKKKKQQEQENDQPSEARPAATAPAAFSTPEDRLRESLMREGARHMRAKLRDDAEAVALLCSSTGAALT